MKKKFAVIAVAIMTMAMPIGVLADGTVTAIQNAASGNNPFSGVIDAMQSFTSNSISCLLLAAACAAMIAAAVAILKMTFGGQRAKDEGKGAIALAIILFIVAIPGVFYGIARLIENVGNEINFDGGEGDGGGEDSLTTYNIIQPEAEQSEYSVFL